MADGSTAIAQAYAVFYGDGPEPAPNAAEAAYLRGGLDQPGRKLPLFDRRGQRVRRQVILACLARGWAERWFENPLAPDWLVCRLTEAGVRAAGRRG